MVACSVLEANDWRAEGVTGILTAAAAIGVVLAPFAQPASTRVRSTRPRSARVASTRAEWLPSPTPISGLITASMRRTTSTWSGPRYCTGTGDRSKVGSLAGALKIADNLVAADSQGLGLSRFAAGPYAHTESTALAAASGSLGIGKPAAALAGFVEAHRLAPADPVPLIDAAPLLTEAGDAQAALAVLNGRRN